MILLARLAGVVPIWAWALAAAMAWGAWHRHAAQAAAAERTEARAAAVAQQAAASAAVTLLEIDHDASFKATARRVAADRAAVAGDGLRLRAAAVADGAASAATAGRCDDAAAAARVLADVPGRLEPAGRAIAAWADELSDALSACQRAYDAVTKP